MRVVASAIPEGKRFEARLRFDRAPEAWASYFLAADDRAQLDGRDLQLDLGPDVIDKGVLVSGDFQWVESIELLLDGEPLSGSALLLPSGEPYKGAPLPLGELLGPEPPVQERGVGQGPRLWLWLPDATPTQVPGEIDAETLRRLRALGYV